MKALLAILEVILRALLPVLLERSQPTAEDGRRQPELRDRLRRRVRESWGRYAVIVLLAGGLLLPGCGTRTVYVPPGEPMRLRATVRRAKVFSSSSKRGLSSGISSGTFKTSWTSIIVWMHELRRR